LLIGHFAAYPMMFLSAAASMSLSIVIRAEAIEAVQTIAAPRTPVEQWLASRVGMGAPEAAAFAIVMEPVLVLLAVLFVVSHLAAIPWAAAARRAAIAPEEKPGERRAARRFVAATATTTGVVILAGL